MSAVEYWLCRVVARPAMGELGKRAHVRLADDTDETMAARWWVPEACRPPTVDEWRALQRGAVDGVVQRAPDGAVVEPLEGYSSEEVGRAKLRAAERSYPWQEFRLMLVAVADGAA